MPTDPYDYAEAKWTAEADSREREIAAKWNALDTAQLKAHKVKSERHAMAASTIATEALTARAKRLRELLIEGHGTVGERSTIDWSAERFADWTEQRINEEAATLRERWPWPENKAKYYQPPIDRQREAENEVSRVEFTRHFQTRAGVLPTRMRELPCRVLRMFGWIKGSGD